MLKTVTITGADDSIDPKEILSISKQYPFVEWGILFSARQIGNNRFPSQEWLDELGMEYYGEDVPDKLQLSLHVCGKYVRDFLSDGKGSFANILGSDLWEMFKRVQLNTHAGAHGWNSNAIAKYIRDNQNKEFIFQLDGVNDMLLESLHTDHEVFNISGLHDKSHGAGIVPKTWDAPMTTIKTGYAGGLGPDNLRDQIEIITSLSNHSGTEIWIDMETKVRSNDDQKFDLDKVIKCLEISKPFITS